MITKTDITSALVFVKLFLRILFIVDMSILTREKLRVWILNYVKQMNKHFQKIIKLMQ